MLNLVPSLKPVEVKVPFDGSLVKAAEEELSQRAQVDDDKCYGYFPAMERAGIDANLPASRLLAEAIPDLRIGNLNLGFNFLRMSLVEQQASASFHLDSDAATALTGDLDSLDHRQVWRLLLNLHSNHARTLAFLNVDPFSLPLARRENYVYCPEWSINPVDRKSIAIPPRQANAAHGVLFCSSQVLHSGQDDEHGHFIAAYGAG